jgi:hypothetical protein
MATQKIEKEKLDARAKAWEEDAVSQAEIRYAIYFFLITKNPKNNG